MIAWVIQHPAFNGIDLEGVSHPVIYCYPARPSAEQFYEILRSKDP